MDGELAALNQKLDLLTKQVQYLTEQAELAACRRAERDELIHDLTPIVNDVFRLTTEQLEEVQSYVDFAICCASSSGPTAQRSHRLHARSTRELDGPGADGTRSPTAPSKRRPTGCSAPSIGVTSLLPNAAGGWWTAWSPR